MGPRTGRFAFVVQASSLLFTLSRLEACTTTKSHLRLPRSSPAPAQTTSPDAQSASRSAGRYPGTRRGRSGSRAGGLAASAPSVARWLGDIRRYFPTGVVQVMQRVVEETYPGR